MATIEIKTPADRYKAIADAIREKNGSTELIQPADMPSVILSLSGGTTLNIAYGETPPEDTSKLWIKANEPENVSVGSDIEGVGNIATVGRLPTESYAMGCVRVANKIYLFGGNYKNTINVFDVGTNTITTLPATLSVIMNNYMGCASVGTKIYLFGGDLNGSTYQNHIDVFDTETETLKTLETRLPTRLCGMGCASVGTKIYLFGGRTKSTTFTNTLYTFDTQTETLTKLSATLSSYVTDMGCASMGDKIYLFGGRYNSNTFNTIYKFDTKTETLTLLKATLPSAVYGLGCVSIGTKIYLFGGYGAGSKIYEFDPETEAITLLETTLPISIYAVGCSAYGNKVYLFGGYSSSALNPINCFTLTHELEKGDIEVQSGLLNNKFNLINTESAKVQIGVENVYVGNENNEAERVDAYLHNGTEWVQV